MLPNRPREQVVERWKVLTPVGGYEFATYSREADALEICEQVSREYGIRFRVKHVIDSF